MSEAKRDGTRIEAWHVVHKCWITVRFRKAGEYGSAIAPWVEVTGSNSWPESAFSCFRPESPPPTVQAVRG